MLEFSFGPKKRNKPKRVNERITNPNDKIQRFFTFPPIYLFEKLNVLPILKS